MIKIKSINLRTILLFFLLTIALILRTINLEETPKGLQSDEASFLINAVSLMQTGRDEDGRFLPLYLHSLIDSKPALYAYLQIPFLAIFGVNTASSRLPSAIIGVASIYLFYRLIKTLTKDDWLAILSAGILTVSPWHIMNSRATQEVILSFFFMLANFNIFAEMYLSNKYILKKYLLFFLTLILAMYSYHSAKVILLGFYFSIFCAYYFVNKNKLQRKQIFNVLLLVITGFIVTAASAITRFSAIGIFHNDLPLAYIHAFTTKSTGSTPLLLLRAFYNKPWFYFKFFLEHYLAHFNLNFLFTTGGATMRFLVPHHGLFYIIEAPLLLIGIYQFIKKRNFTKLLLPVTLLIFLSPIPSALTIEEIPSSIRSFTFILPLAFLIAIGLKLIFTKLNKLFLYPSWLIICLAYIWSLGFFLQQFFIIMPIWQPWYRSRSYEVAANYLSNINPYQNNIHVASDLREMYIYLWLNKLITIEEIQAQPLARYKERYDIGKFIFDQRQCYFEEVSKNDLLVAPHDCKDKIKFEKETLFEASFDDNSPGFVIMKKD